MGVDTQPLRIRPPHAYWIIGLYSKLRNLEEIIKRKFKVSINTDDEDYDFREENSKVCEQKVKKIQKLSGI